jgi:ion channel-forming bestrophin family protein
MFSSSAILISLFLMKLCQEEDDEDGLQREWSGPVHSMKVGHSKRRPRVAGDGENLPLEIVRCLSEWYSVLEDRGTVAGGFY